MMFIHPKIHYRNIAKICELLTAIQSLQDTMSTKMLLKKQFPMATCHQSQKRPISSRWNKLLLTDTSWSQTSGVWSHKLGDNESEQVLFSCDDNYHHRTVIGKTCLLD